jgi:CDP-diacylglycerol--glycerol-3-phosphate 3-phosphatidyltransferase
MHKQIPNILTYIRLALIPVFVALMVSPTRAMVDAAALVFILAAITDLFDGILARKWGAVSDLGKLLDPLADKILVMAGLVMLVSQRGAYDSAPWIPGWMVVLIMSRELWVTGIRGVAATRGIVVPAGNAGKLKSVLQMVAIVCVMIFDRKITLLGYKFTFQLLGLNLLLLSIMFSVWGAVDYTIRALGPFAPEDKK